MEDGGWRMEGGGRKMEGGRGMGEWEVAFLSLRSGQAVAGAPRKDKAGGARNDRVRRWRWIRWIR
jgi:hypothetical protein